MSIDTDDGISREDAHAIQGFAENAQRMTYEYGNTFLLVAGLLNYLATLDAFDIAAGRKE